MKKYFYSDGNNNFGPFTIEELKEKGITRETMIWFHELSDWKQANTVQELNDLFALMPPPMQQPSEFNQLTFKQKSSNNMIDIFVFSSIAYWFALYLVYFVIFTFADFFNKTPAKYFLLGANIIFAAIPIFFAISVKNKSLKIIAIILGTLMFIFIFYINILLLIEQLK